MKEVIDTKKKKNEKSRCEECESTCDKFEILM